MEAADGDRDDKVSLSLRGPDARYSNRKKSTTNYLLIHYSSCALLPNRSFSIRETGELILRSAATINGSLARLVAVASDSGRPPRFVGEN